MAAIMALSIVGMYNHDNSVFDGFNLPEGMEKDACITEILMQCAELELIYQDWDFMKMAITKWSIINQSVWQKLYDTTQFEYNPIWNVDGTVTETETRDLAGTDSGSLTRTTSGSLKRTTSGSSQTSGTLEHDVMGYNVASGYQHESKDTQSSSSSDSGSMNDTESGSVNDTDSRSRTDTGTITRETTRGGNIGVTMTQQMIEAERQVDLFNIYDKIVSDFKRRFCVLVY